MLENKLNFIEKYLMKKTYSKYINSSNIEKITLREINSIFRDEPSDKNKYSRFVLSEWLKIKDENEVTLKTLKRLIKKLNLELTTLEKHNLQILEERVFSSYRHIKELDIDYPKLRGEKFLIKFTDAELLQNNKRLLIINQGDLLISNKRIILRGSSNNEFQWKQIGVKLFKGYGFEFVSNNKRYVIRIHDQITLNNTIENLIKKRLK